MVPEGSSTGFCGAVGANVNIDGVDGYKIHETSEQAWCTFPLQSGIETRLLRSTIENVP